jgi:hypothetical protein
MLQVVPSVPTPDSASIGVMFEYLSLPTWISSPKNTLFLLGNCRDRLGNEPCNTWGRPMAQRRRHDGDASPFFKGARQRQSSSGN